MKQQVDELQITFPREADRIRGGVEANADNVDESTELTLVSSVRVLVHDVDDEAFLLIDFSNKERMRGSGRSVIDEGAAQRTKNAEGGHARHVLMIYQPGDDIVDERRTVGAETARNGDGYNVGASAQSEEQRALGGPAKTVICAVDVGFGPHYVLAGEIKPGTPQNGDVRGRRRRKAEAKEKEKEEARGE